MKRGNTTVNAKNRNKRIQKNEISGERRCWKKNTENWRVKDKKNADETVQRRATRKIMDIRYFTSLGEML